jgi:hypothetical protein
MTAEAGQLAKTIGIEIISRGVAASTTITRGDVVGFDANGFVIVGDESLSIAEGFGVAKETVDNSTGSAGDLTVEIAVGNTWVYCRAAGAIKPLKLVICETGTSTGDVVTHAKPANAAAIFDELEIDAARDYFGKTVGRYMGHEGEEAEMTDAADLDVIKVRLGL